MIKRLFKDFKQRTLKEYYKYTHGNYGYILISSYSNTVNKIAIDNKRIIQYRDIVFGAPNSYLIDFENQLIERGYKNNKDLLLRQLTREKMTDVLNDPTQKELIDWFIGEDDIMF